MPKPKRAHRKLNFTKDAIRALPRPATGRAYHYDTRQPGLAVCVLPTGRRTFYLVRWASGRSRKVRIGAFPETTIEQARRKGRKLSSELDEGKDPAVERRRLRHEPTLEDVFNDYVHAVEGKVRVKSLKNDRSLWTRLQPMGNRRLSTFTQEDLEELHRAIGIDESKPTQANRVLELAGKLFHRAAYGPLKWDGRSPCRLVRNGSSGGIRRFDENERERHLNDRDPAELQRFLTLLTVEPDLHFRAFVLVSLFTGSRKTTVANMRREDLALDANEWRIPPGEGTKSRRRMRIPLAAGVVKLLRGLPHRHPDYVFRNGRSELTGAKYGWPRLKAHFRGLYFHDVRRTTGALLATLGASDRILKTCLGHCSSKALDHYAHLTFCFPRTVKLGPIRKRLLSAAKPVLAHAEAVVRVIEQCGRTTIAEIMHDE